MADWPDMGHQQDSIDISQLKAVALGTRDASVAKSPYPGRSYTPVLNTPSSLQAVQTRATTATSQSTKSRKSPKIKDALVSSNIRPRQQLSNAVDLGQRNATQKRGHDVGGLPAPQIGPSKFMSELSNIKMHSNSTPSEGDTQPASQWVYGEKEVGPMMSKVSHVNEEGDTGHINIVDGFEQDLGPGAESTMLVEDNEEDDVELVSQDIRAELFPESRRFQPPMTPLAKATKRKRPMQEETPQLPTPRLPANPFADLGTSDVMRPSQIFQATQAQTSPQYVHSDSLYERPSPNMHNSDRPSTACTLSSPAMARDPRSKMVRTVTEPQVTYESMKESQEARERRLRELHMEQDALLDAEFDPPSRIQPQQSLGQGEYARNVNNHSAGRSLSTSSTQQFKVKGNASSQGGQSTRRLKRQLSEVFLISDDPLAEENRGNITEDETEREEEKEEAAHVDEIDELAEENKENVEVPMTVSRLHHARVISSQTSPSRNHVRRRLKTPSSQSATQVKGSPRRTTSPSSRPASEKGTQLYAVRDSQSSQQQSSKEHPRALDSSRPQHSLEPRNVVLQSQLSLESKSPIPQSSVPSKSATGDVIIQLTSSSPLQLSKSRSKSSEIGYVRQESSVDLEAQGNKNMGITHITTHPSNLHAIADDACQTESHNIRKQVSRLSTRNGRTVFGTNLEAELTAPVRNVVPNSSQDMSSSGPLPSSLSKIATKKSSNGQSLATSLYETAQDQLSLSPSKSVSQPLLARSLESGVSSPNKNLRRRTLGEIAADPSPPDPIEDVNLSDFGLLGKEDEDFHEIIHGPIRPHLITRKRRAYTSTKWKAPASDPPSECQGTPARPTSSAISAPTPVQIFSEAESQNSSPLSSPPASQHEELPSLASPDNILETSNPQAAPFTDAPASTSVHEPSASSLAVEVSALEAGSQGEALNAGSQVTSNLPIVAPDRVFAHFNGKPSAFYSATCLGVIPGDEPRYSVHYDDGAEDSISAFGIKRLEFRPGDVVKVDLPVHRTKNYVVVGMQDRQDFEGPNTLARRRKINPSDKDAWPETDIYGHTKVLLSPKQSKALGGKHMDVEAIVVGIYHLYFTQAMWTNIKDREYIHVDRRSMAVEGLQTPADRPSTPSSPPSRAKRLKSTLLNQATSMNGPKQGLFSRMTFSLTNICQPGDLERIKSLILTHGGKVLEDGFDPLFHVPVLHRITSPRKSDSDRNFHLTSQAQDMGFTCLIADRHCRRAKYIQALALGIPCLATRWISDCVSKQRILTWSVYLLPAGESTFLGGAAHSRILPALSTENATLSTLVEQRTCMLEGASILLIMSKNEEANMRQHPLLTFALGPARVARALSIEAAAKAVAEAHAVGKPWDWVFSYDREREVERVLFGSAAKKRKSRADQSGQKVKTRVIGNEFLIQSLILGQLLDE